MIVLIIDLYHSYTIYSYLFTLLLKNREFRYAFQRTLKVTYANLLFAHFQFDLMPTTK